MHDMDTHLVVGYIRISREDRDKPNYSPVLQEERIRGYAERTWQELPHEVVIYQDIGQTGALGLRQHPDFFPKFRKGLSDAIDHLVEQATERNVHLVCLDQSRLERDPLVWEALKTYRKTHGIRFHLVDEGGEAERTPEGDLTRSVSSAANANYRAQAGRRQRASHEHRAHQGYAHGVPPYGWRRVPKSEGQKWHDIEPVSEQRDALVAIKDNVLSGWGSWRIARWLDDQGIASPSGRRGWYPETVLAVVRSPIHAGFIEYHGERIKGQHFDKRLWDIELTDELDRLILQQHRARRRGLRLGEFMLAGMLTCGHCARPLTSTYDSTTGKRYYVCNGRAVPACNSHRAVSKIAELLERAVVEGIMAVLSDGFLESLTVQEVAAAAEKQVKELQALTGRYQQQQSETTKDLTECISMHRCGELSDVAFQNVKRDYEQRLEHLGQQLEQVSRRRRHLQGDEVRMEHAKEAAHNLPLLWQNLDTEERRGLLQALLEDIIVLHEGRHLRLQLRFHFLGCQERLLRSCKSSPEGDGVERLTMRELGFLHLWSQGVGYGEIAAAFGIARGAARQHGLSIRKKLGVPTVDAAVDIARDHFELNLPFLPIEGRAHKKQADRTLLSSREMLVLEALAEGLTYAKCALGLGITLAAAYNAAYAARQKLGAADNLDALIRARQLEASEIARSC
jgi:DNA invertase Pin-like site-specific DNA recombinase/DNA-binding CsgD family transcriptional regulator